MIDSLSNLLFGCRHRRTSFPQSPVSPRGAQPEDMYVACLDCGKRFRYDWEQMRIGAPVGAADRKSSKLRYFLVACSLPALWLIGKVALSQKHRKPDGEAEPELKHGHHND